MAEIRSISLPKLEPIDRKNRDDHNPYFSGLNRLKSKPLDSTGRHPSSLPFCLHGVHLEGRGRPFFFHHFVEI